MPGKGVRLRKVKSEQSGEYVCRASNNVGSDIAAATVYVMEPPTITRKPKATTTVEPGAKVKLPCQAKGRPSPLILW